MKLKKKINSKIPQILKNTCICCLFPAVILEIVQHVSLQIDSLQLDPLQLVSKCSKHGRAEQFSIICVCMSSPVTMLPIARRAGETTVVSLCLTKEN